MQYFSLLLVILSLGYFIIEAWRGIALSKGSTWAAIKTPLLASLLAIVTLSQLLSN